MYTHMKEREVFVEKGIFPLIIVPFHVVYISRVWYYMLI